MFAITLGKLVQMLGPMPNEAAAMVRATMERNETMDMVTMGCALEMCMKRGSYDTLLKMVEK